MVIWGNRYRDREVIIGSTPDTLTCTDGGPSTWRECEAAVKWGSSILLLALKSEADYRPESLPITYKKSEAMSAAVKAGTMAVCSSVEAIPDSINQILGTLDTSRRPERAKELYRLLNQPVTTQD